MPVDYSRFQNLGDSSDEEAERRPVWRTTCGRQVRGFTKRQLEELEAGVKRLQARKGCYVYVDFEADLAQLREAARKLQDAPQELPPLESRSLGRVVIEISQTEHAPRLCENLRLLCTGERGLGVGGQKLHYKGRRVNWIMPYFCVQVSVENEYSCWGRYLEDEQLRIPGVGFDAPGVVAFGNHGPDTNTCSLMVAMHAAPSLDGANQIVGRVVRGMEVLRKVELMPTEQTEQSFVEKNVRTWRGGKPLVDVVVSGCGELPEAEARPEPPEDGDVFPVHPVDYDCQGGHDALMGAAERLRQIGNGHYRAKRYDRALEKYEKCLAYLQPLLKEQHVAVELERDDPKVWMGGGVTPKTRTEVVRAQLAAKLNICQVHLSCERWREAVRVADAVLLDLVGRPGGGSAYNPLPLEELTAKAFFRRARAYVGLSAVPGEVSRLEEAILDLNRALEVDPKNPELLKEMERVQHLQRAADIKGREVWENMLKPEGGSG